MKSSRAVSPLLAVSAPAKPPPSAVPFLAPPVAKRIAHVDTLRGEVHPDNWHWLREKENPEVVAYLKAENAHTKSRLEQMLPLQEKLYQQMMARIRETDGEAPYPKETALHVSFALAQSGIRQ